MGKTVYTSQYKSRIVLETLREEKLVGEIALENNLNPNMLRNWRKEFLEKAPRLFEASKREAELAKKEQELEEERRELLNTIGQLTVERDWLKKKSVEIFGVEYEKKFNKR